MAKSRVRRADRRTTLSREHVLREALTLLDRGGLDRFSLRRLADHLGVTPMAVYNHVNSKQDLLQGIAASVIEGMRYRRPGGSWQTIIRQCFRTLRRGCLAHPGAIPLIETAEALPPSVFRPMEITLNALQGIGFSVDDALRAHWLLTTFTLGQVSYQVRGWSRGVDAQAAVNEGRIDPTTFPAVVQATARGRWDFDKSFEFGLSTILAGLAARARRHKVLTFDTKTR